MGMHTSSLPHLLTAVCCDARLLACSPTVYQLRRNHLLTSSYRCAWCIRRHYCCLSTYDSCCTHTILTKGVVCTSYEAFSVRKETRLKSQGQYQTDQSIVIPCILQRAQSATAYVSAIMSFRRALLQKLLLLAERRTIPNRTSIL